MWRFIAQVYITGASQPEANVALERALVARTGAGQIKCLLKTVRLDTFSVSPVKTLRVPDGYRKLKLINGNNFIHAESVSMSFSVFLLSMMLVNCCYFLA